MGESPDPGSNSHERQSRRTGRGSSQSAEEHRYSPTRSYGYSASPPGSAGSSCDQPHTQRRQSMIARFPSLRLEGGLISSDQIDRVADQKVKEFTIDDIAAAWSDVRSYWSIFQNHLARLPEDDLATTITRRNWMNLFFSTLGYELSSRTAAEVDGQTYAISHRAGSNDDSPPVHIVGIRQSLDRRPDSGR